ncbi:hypothetical protein COV12_03035 [Candidatus Woesearchaeota archaeon CG10_big_fil_rev_8_21_14_0_10_32_24]|nr:MAG: hypothetical protein COV12_03035 [Candidatus Woesearchaeota archaeon CG10_big_fil_rev_8_21_14_0_10_32_24]
MVETLSAKQSFFAGIVVTLIILLVKIFEVLKGNDLKFQFSSFLFVLLISSIFLLVYREALWVKSINFFQFSNHQKWKKLACFFLFAGISIILWYFLYNNVLIIFLILIVVLIILNFVMKKEEKQEVKNSLTKVEIKQRINKRSK